MTCAISVVYSTSRIDPRFEWFADSLARQIGDDDPEVILVDANHSRERTTTFEAAVRGRFRLRHVAAKPTPYSGPYRRTSQDFFSAASARNTGIVYATAPHVAFVDDLSVLSPSWWAEVKASARAGDVTAGAYEKRWEMEVRDGVLISGRCDTTHPDPRWDHGSDAASVPADGAFLFGCSFAAPRSLLLEVNGFDELCDSIGGEDCHLGVRLMWAGGSIRYSRRMLTIESEEMHRLEPGPIRSDRTVPPSVYIRRLREFGVSARRVNGAFDSSHMVLDLLWGAETPQTLGNAGLLTTLDLGDPVRLAARFPDEHWFDRRALASL
jgi:hypothetical protein